MTTGGRDLSAQVDKFGNISVQIEIGGILTPSGVTGMNSKPATVAMFLRDLANDVDAAR